MKSLIIKHFFAKFVGSLLIKTTYPLLLILLIIIITGHNSFSQGAVPSSLKELKKLSIDELMNVEVDLVSRSPQKLSGAASAVQVITGEDIRHSGANNIADALRLVANLQVAQYNSEVWLISARGFNTVFANKLLVMIDGRSVYTPLFAGVLWEMQNVLLEDVDRIEVVSGPGGTLWGANAVNGVINIITKSSEETKGLYASVLAGTFVKDQAAVRWGGSIGKELSYRMYGQHFDRNATTQPNGQANNDKWKLTQGGFRMDWKQQQSNDFTIQGDYFGGAIKSLGGNSDFNGQNILGRWNHKVSEKSDFTLQLYYDRYIKKDATGLTSDEMKTFDIDFQYRFSISEHHSILSGLGYRGASDDFVSKNPQIGILPEKKDLNLFNAFIQDEITISDRLKFTAGSKVLHNVYTGFEFQPGVRMSFTVNKNNTLWGAVSRAVRTPSRLDVDYFSPATPPPPTTVSIAGGGNFKSEKALLYELGYRVLPNTKSSFSVAFFYNIYRDIYSLELLPNSLMYQTMNGSEGTSWGAELSGTYQLSDKVRIKGGYTYFDISLKAKPGHAFNPSYLSNDVHNQLVIQSMTDLPLGIHFDIIARFLDHLPQTLATAEVPAYFTFDSRLAYTYKQVEISVVGQNLYNKKHTEFNNSYVPRSIYAKLTFRF